MSPSSNPSSNSSPNPATNSAPPTYLTPQELTQWQAALAEADRHNIFCHCHSCGYEWVSSQRIPEHPQITERSRSAECPQCKGSKIESIACWQFPDD
jgi:hypothetical protein